MKNYLIRFFEIDYILFNYYYFSLPYLPIVSLNVPILYQNSKFKIQNIFCP